MHLRPGSELKKFVILEKQSWSVVKVILVYGLIFSQNFVLNYSRDTRNNDRVGACFR